MVWAFQFGNVQIKPSPVESVLFAGGAGAAVYGLWNGKWWTVLTGSLVVGTIVYRLWEKKKEVESPELMNGYFLTDGQFSATQSMGDKRALAGILGL